MMRFIVLHVFIVTLLSCGVHVVARVHDGQGRHEMGVKHVDEGVDDKARGKKCPGKHGSILLESWI